MLHQHPALCVVQSCVWKKGCGKLYRVYSKLCKYTPQNEIATICFIKVASMLNGSNSNNNSDMPTCVTKKALPIAAVQRKYLRLAPTILHCSTFRALHNVHDTCYVFSRWWVNNVRIPFDSRDNAFSPRKIAVTRETDSRDRESEWESPLSAVWGAMAKYKIRRLMDVKEAHVSCCVHIILLLCFTAVVRKKRVSVFLSLAASLLIISLLLIILNRQSVSY